VIPIAVGQRGVFYDIIPQLMARKGEIKYHKEGIGCCEVSRMRLIWGYPSAFYRQIIT
jgi:uncharacterized protein (DUF779 family)